MEGYVKIFRKLLEWEWYDDTNTKVVFLHCLLKANFADRNWRGIEIKRGQFITSVAAMAEELNLSGQQTRTALAKLQKTGEITIESTNKYSIVTICNYDSYQEVEETEQQTNQQSNNNQTTNKQQTNNNNVRRKEGKNDNNNININTTPNGDSVKPTTRFQKPSIDDVKAYVAEKGYMVDAERFWNYYESNGWKVGRNTMKDWRAAVRTWATKDNKPQATPIPAIPTRVIAEPGIVNFSEEMGRLQELKERQRAERERRQNTLNL